MRRVNEIILLLEAALSNQANLEKNIRQFQEIVWNEEFVCSVREKEILGDLAYDLEFYVPNPEWRKEDPSHYGDKKAIDEIKNALDKIKMGQ